MTLTYEDILKDRLRKRGLLKWDDLGKYLEARMAHDEAKAIWKKVKNEDC